MNFIITPGDHDYLTKEADFIQYYNAGELTTREIKDQLELSENEYRQLRRKCINDGSIVLRKPGRRKEDTYKTNPRNYAQHICKGIPYFTVYKNGEYFCNVKREDDAEEIVRRLRRCGWDRRCLNGILEDVLG